MEATETHLHTISVTDQCAEYSWCCENTIPFDELIVSWNAQRPEPKGAFDLHISALVEGEWSEWIHYATWGSEARSGGNSSDSKNTISSYQDIAHIKNGKFATAFKVKVEAKGSAKLLDFHTLYGCVSRPKELTHKPHIAPLPSVDLQVPALSQMSLPHPLCHHMCSATSTSAVVTYLLKSPKGSINPVSVALNAHDGAFDIFGNWTFMAAHAYALLGKGWRCSVQRLRGFDDIHRRLSGGYPVVVSIRGPLTGSALPYESGHLLAVRGYDAERDRVLCMDPAFDEKNAHVDYPLQDFLEAWGRRGYVAYVFDLV